LALGLGGKFGYLADAYREIWGLYDTDEQAMEVYREAYERAIVELGALTYEAMRGLAAKWLYSAQEKVVFRNSFSEDMYDLDIGIFGGNGINLVDAVIKASEEAGLGGFFTLKGGLSCMSGPDGRLDWDMVDRIGIEIFSEKDEAGRNTLVDFLERFKDILSAAGIDIHSNMQGDRALTTTYITLKSGRKFLVDIDLMYINKIDRYWDDNEVLPLSEQYFGRADLLEKLFSKKGLEKVVRAYIRVFVQKLTASKRINGHGVPMLRVESLKWLYSAAFIVGAEERYRYLLDIYKGLKSRRFKGTDMTEEYEKAYAMALAELESISYHQIEEAIKKRFFAAPFVPAKHERIDPALIKKSGEDLASAAGEALVPIDECVVGLVVKVRQGETGEEVERLLEKNSAGEGRSSWEKYGESFAEKIWRGRGLVPQGVNKVRYIVYADDGTASADNAERMDEFLAKLKATGLVKSRIFVWLADHGRSEEDTRSGISELRSMANVATLKGDYLPISWQIFTGYVFSGLLCGLEPSEGKPDAGNIAALGALIDACAKMMTGGMTEHVDIREFLAGRLILALPPAVELLEIIEELRTADKLACVSA
jgi:hypothetical protein